jgi:hypothetical protein
MEGHTGMLDVTIAVSNVIEIPNTLCIMKGHTRMLDITIEVSNVNKSIPVPHGCLQQGRASATLGKG